MEKQTRLILLYVMIGVGFLMVLTNAMDYLLGWGLVPTVSSAVGIALFIIGSGLIRREISRK